MVLINILLICCWAWPSVSAKALWASTPASYENIIREAYPVGNGKLGAMPLGFPGPDKVNINVDSLWSGGPFMSDQYTGGNPKTAKYYLLPSIRQWVFQNGTGNVTGLLGDNNSYGTYSVLGNLSVVIDGISETSSYNRSLDLSTGMHKTTYTANDGNQYIVTVYCSYPHQVCIYNIKSSAELPQISVKLENLLMDPSLLSISCGNGFVRLTGLTQTGPPTGMKFEAIARLTTRVAIPSYCSNTTDEALIIPSSSHIRTLNIVIGAGTNYDQTKGNAENNFSFRGADPGPYVENVTASAAGKSESDLRIGHIKDYQHLADTFSLDLPDLAGSAGLETSVILNQYVYTGTGDPYLESLLFAYARHLFISSSRDHSLPPNLQGKWASATTTAWGGDYHANINFQMNLWGADQMGLGELQSSVWSYMQDTWVPRGIETARLLYGASGWVTHDEMNIFGHTGMKYSAQWANYPASAAWMMQHVWDHYEYSQNDSWFRSQGYPLIKGVAQFWLSQLQADKYFHDGTLVVCPCNSPEHGPSTFACTHYQQLLHQVFEAIVSASTVVAEKDTVFLNNITSALKILDRGFHIGAWGEVKEWKIPDSFGYDFENDTHRHLSNLVGWYPGYSISSFLGGYRNATIQNAIVTTLYSRGLGKGPDANAGWAKVWRSACWARLNRTDMAYLELKYAIDQNFANNGLSMYSGAHPPFQIDANFGLAGAVLSMLIVDLPQLSSDTAIHRVILGPAIPATWAGGQVKGLRLRGGGYVNFSWDSQGLVVDAHLVERAKAVLLMNKEGKVLAKY